MQVQRQILDVTSRSVVIELPESFVNHRVEFIVLTDNDEILPPLAARRPHPDIAGKGMTLEDIVSPVVEANDWDCLK